MELNKTEYSNIPSSIEEKLTKKLHNQKNHPIEIMKNHIYHYFINSEECNNFKFTIFDDLSPVA